jgi:hypothetical protein
MSNGTATYVVTYLGNFTIYNISLPLKYVYFESHPFSQLPVITM